MFNNLIKRINKMNTKTKFESGLIVYKGDWAGSHWTITGNMKRSFTIKEFESAYDFEEYIKGKIDCRGIEFDSDFCQFFAYTTNQQKAIKFAQSLESYFTKLRNIL
jgi:hypothetical protein